MKNTSIHLFSYNIKHTQNTIGIVEALLKILKGRYQAVFHG